MPLMRVPTFYEFFAGGGMARAGLGPDWRCLFANDLDAKKAASYASNWGGSELFVGDVASIAAFELPGLADLAWASFPCQDLSLAGNGAGLEGDRSGAFWPFWRLIRMLARERRAPNLIVLENVSGLLTSHGGKDFFELCRAMSNEGYRVAPLIIDAVHLIPQSRPRLFMVGVRDGLRLPPDLFAAHPSKMWHPLRLRDAHQRLPDALRSRWLWLDAPAPPRRNVRLVDLIEDDPRGVEWHTEAQTDRLLAMMSPANRAKVDSASLLGERMIGAVYKRTRHDAGVKIQRAEVRFDDVAGCLRTPGGGSSRQTIVIVEGAKVRSRLLSARETARLMGLPEEYRLPDSYYDACHLTGDGVAVPVVKFLAETTLRPLLAAQVEQDLLAAAE